MKRTFVAMLSLAFVCMLALWISCPAAYASTAGGISAQINAINGLSAGVAGNVVTVAGTAQLSANLTLNIDSGVAVNWNATLTGSATANNYLLTLTGRGAFTVGGGGKISVTTGAGGTVYISDGVTLNVTNGSIESPGSGSAVTVAAGTLGAVINVNGVNGKIVSVPNGYAINDGSGMTASSNNTRVNISAGLVESGSACAIRSTGIASVVAISGGEVRNAAASNTNSTVYMNYAPAPNNNLNNIIVSGGLVRTTNTGNQSYVLQSSQNILISGGEVQSIAGRAVNLVGSNSTATVTGGRVSTVSGTAVSTATTTLDEVNDAKVVISGGIVEATGTGTAVRITGYNSTAAVSGNAKVLATSGLAIDASGRPAAGSVRVNGGLVFAWGNAINKVISPENKLNPSVGGVVAAWNTATGIGAYDYVQNASNDLSALPAGSVVWDNEPPTASYGGIRYGGNFHRLDVVVVQNVFTLTVVNGTADGGATTLRVPAGASVNIFTQDTPIVPGLNPNLYPINGNKFDKWTANVPVTFTGGASLMASSLVMPASDVTVMANFKPLYVFRITGGEITGPLPLTSYGNVYGYYAEGDIININAYTSPWNTAPGWLKTTGGGSFDNSGSPSTVFTMPGEPVTVYVDASRPPNPAYKPVQYTTTVVNGTITVTTAGTAPSSPTSHTGYMGTGLNITANPPAPGMQFDYWEVTVSGSGGSSFDSRSATTVYTMPSGYVTITAIYTVKEYSLTVNGGTGAPGPHFAGAGIPITAAAPPTGMRFSGWTIDSGGGLFDDPSLSGTKFTMPDSDAEITANYEYIGYTITVQNGADILGAGLYHYGEKIEISADTPGAGVVFNGWIIVSGSGTFGSVSALETLFTMPAENVIISAAYSSASTGPGVNTSPPSRPPSKLPKTGDNGNIGLYGMWMALSLAGIGIVIKARKTYKPKRVHQDDT